MTIAFWVLLWVFLFTFLHLKFCFYSLLCLRTWFFRIAWFLLGSFSQSNSPSEPSQWRWGRTETMFIRISRCLGRFSGCTPPQPPIGMNPLLPWWLETDWSPPNYTYTFLCIFIRFSPIYRSYIYYVILFRMVNFINLELLPFSHNPPSSVFMAL